jgi:hypothetical protein
VHPTPSAPPHPLCLLQEHIEPCLLLALDQEGDAATAAALRAAVAVLLGAGVGAAPGYWLSLLGAVTLAAGPAAKGQPRAGEAGRRWRGEEGMVLCFEWLKR